jgi:hypothetical protein
MVAMGGQGRRAGATAVHFSVRTARCYHLVFAGAQVREWAWLDPGELADRTRRWWGGRADPTLVELVGRLVDRAEAVRIEAIERPDGPALPPVVAPARLDAATTARLAEATHVLRVEADNPAAADVGYPGLWSALAVAGAAAAGSGGVWLDAGALRVRSGLDGLTPRMGPVRVGEHLLITQSREGGGGVALTTTGLASFGLPELLVFGVPLGLAPAAALVLQGVAQRLVEGLVTDLRDAARRGEVPTELVVTGAHVDRAAPGAPVREGGAARVQLMYRHAATDGGADHLAVEPVPADLRRPRGEWLRLLLADLLAS